MKRTSIRTAAFALLSFTSAAFADVMEDFDRLPAQEIHPAAPLVLDRFRVDLPLGGVASIREAEGNDDLESGMAMGASPDWTLSHLELTFNEPWQRLTFTLVMPETAEQGIRSLVMLYGADPSSPAANVTLFWHGPERRRVRVEMVRMAADEPFQRVNLHLMRGAYIDNLHVQRSGSGLDLAAPIRTSAW